MRIVSERALREYGAKHGEAVAALAVWKRMVRNARWRTYADVNASCPSADLVGDKTVFNMALNRHRLIAFISFRTQAVYIKSILSHRDYEKGEWKK